MEVLKDEIIYGKLLDHNLKMPPEMELIDLYGVSRITVRKAIQTLVDEGVLYRKRGKGTFLIQNQVESWTGKLMGFSENMESQGLKTSSKVLAFGKVLSPSNEIKTEMNLEQGWQLKRLRFAEGRPIAIEESVFPLEIGGELEKQDLETLLTYSFVENNMRILLSNGRQIINAVKANAEQAALLSINENDPLLYVKRVSYSFDHYPVEHLEAVYHPDYFSYNINLVR